jgi:hypothetical protein
VAISENLRTGRGGGQSRAREPIAASRTPLWLLSGWGCRGRRLSRLGESPSLAISCLPTGNNSHKRVLGSDPKDEAITSVFAHMGTRPAQD